MLLLNARLFFLKIHTDRISESTSDVRDVIKLYFAILHRFHGNRIFIETFKFPATGRRDGGSAQRRHSMNRGHMFDQMMLVHESVSANLATELRQFSAFHALVLKQRFLPLVRFPARFAEESRFVTLLRVFLPLTRSRSLSIMRQLLPH